ncbi:MAG: PAS domain-containing protein, partial [Roseiflexaceae bacterium]
SRGAARFLQFAEGEPSHSLLRVVDPGLRIELRTALFAAIQRRGGTEARRVQFELNDTARLIDLIVQPIQEPAWARGYILVVFNELADAGNIERSAISDTDTLVRQLEEELQRTKDQLRATIEQYETAVEEHKAANEELQAINEELRAATEELETSKEELQSVNEELTTVNQELKHKVEEVSQSNNDLQNLIASTEIGTIFVDRELNIKRYTPSTQALFNLIPADINRPLGHITHKLNYDQLHADTASVLETLIKIEREVLSQEGRWYLARLLPYRTAEGKIDGVILTFVDITSRKQIEKDLDQAHETLELRVEGRTQELTEANRRSRVEIMEYERVEVARGELLRRLVTAQEEERRRIARELHDQFGQQLSALRLGLAALADPAQSDRPDAVPRLQQIAAQLDQDVDRLALELRPTTLDDLGLRVALQQHVEEWAERHSIPAEFQAIGIDRVLIPPEIEIVIYRVTQEALTNVLKHADARHVSVILERRDGQVGAIVEDDGGGFDPEAVQQATEIHHRLGLLGMQERVALVGGTLTIESAPGRGTTVFVHIPLPRTAGGDDHA